VNVPVRPQAILAAAKAELASEESRVDKDVAVPNEWEDLSHADQVESLDDMARAIQAFLAAEEIQPEYELRPDEDGVEPARHARLCGPWRRDDGD
jgi:hypothetical protein